MTKYLDMTKADGCFGVIAENGEEIVFTGVSVNSMPLSVKTNEADAYADFARQYDISFIFDDEIPEIDFYTIPRIDIAAVDGDGGYIGSVGQPFDLSNKVPLVYISKDKCCFLITEDSRLFISIASDWKARLIPFEGIKLYDNKDSAKREFEIIDFEKTSRYRELMELMRNRRKGQA